MRTGPTRRELLKSFGAVATTAGAASVGDTSWHARAQAATSWPMFGHDEANTGYSPDASGPVSEVGPAWQFDTDGPIRGSPAVVDGTVYIGSEDGNVYALSSSSGIEEWRFSTGSDVRSSPAVVPAPGDESAGMRVYVGNQEGTVYALDADSGEVVWRFGTDNSVISSPVVVEDTVYVGSQDNNVYAIDANEGTERWRFETGWFVESSPAVVDGVVYVGSDDQNVYALDTESGEELWRFSTGDRVPSSPAVAAGVVFVGSLDQRVYALDAESGEELWRFDTSGAVTSSPAVADGSGDEAGTVYVGSRSNNLYAVDAEDGEELWRFNAERPIRASPAVTDGVVYVGSSSHLVFAVDSESGEELWQFDTGRPVSGTPAVVDGTVYTGSESQTVYALQEGIVIPTPTPTPAPSGDGGGSDLSFLLLPATVVSVVAVLAGSAYAAIRSGIFDPVDTAQDTKTDSQDDSGDADAAGAEGDSPGGVVADAPADDGPSPIWETMVADVISRATETGKTATQDLVVTKHVDRETLASPVVAYEIESFRSEPARVRITEPLVTQDGSKPLGDGWTVEDDRLVFETVIGPESTRTTLVGRRDCPTDSADELLDRPDVRVEDV